MPVRWSETLAHARSLAADCRAGSGRPVSAADLPWWALPVYVSAHDRQLPVTAVTAADLRYRLADPDALLDWLYEGLLAMGHAASPPAHTATEAGEADAALAWLPHAAASRALAGEPLTDGDRQWLPQPGRQADDDPVVGCWRWGSTMVATPQESSDGLTYPQRASCPLWDYLPTITGLLDEHLILVRGGWPAGTRVTVIGPPYTLLGAADPGIFGNRARVRGPLWALDHDTATLRDGPPIGYWVTYRSRSLTGLGSLPQGPVAADRLGIDLDPLDDDRLSDPAAQSAGSTPPPSAAGTAPAAGCSGPAAGAGHRPRTTVIGDPREHYRRGAVERLWVLRDGELTVVRDSTPRRIAERIVDGSYPAPPDPPTAMTLRLSSDLLSQVSGHHEPDPPPQQEHQLVGGDRRRYLLQWLPEVTGEETTSPHQRRHLDGLGPRPTPGALRQFMADEGFVEVADINGNAGPAPAPCRWPAPPGTPPAADTDQPLHLLVCHPADALLGFLSTFPSSNGSWCRLRIHYCVEPMDPPLFAAGIGASAMWPVFETGVSGHLRHGAIGSDSAGSMRVRLTVVRAFSHPVVPWPHPVPRRVLGLHEPDERSTEVIAGLPGWVHDLFPFVR